MSDGANVLQIETHSLSQPHSPLKIKEIGQLVESVKSVKCCLNSVSYTFKCAYVMCTCFHTFIHKCTHPWISRSWFCQVLFGKQDQCLNEICPANRKREGKSVACWCTVPITWLLVSRNKTIYHVLASLVAYLAVICNYMPNNLSTSSNY